MGRMAKRKVMKAAAKQQPAVKQRSRKGAVAKKVAKNPTAKRGVPGRPGRKY